VPLVGRFFPLGRLFGTQGVRGIVNKTLTPTMVEHLGHALAEFLGGKGTVAVAWDSRISSELLSQAISSGIMASGCDVRPLGLIPTPLLSFAIPRLRCSAGAMVTASHNPPEFNGIKLWQADGAPFVTQDEQQVEKAYFETQRQSLPRDARGHLQTTQDYRGAYTQELIRRVDVDRIRRRKMLVVADCGGGAASVIGPNLLKHVGCRVESLHCILDGRFQGRPPEPREQNLAKLIQCVHEKEADLGVAWDGDADRAVFVTNRSRYMTGDRSFALAAYQQLKGVHDSKKKIVTQVATSDVIYDAAEAANAEVIVTRVGEPNIVATMKKTKAQIGGEENGGVVYRGWSWAREGMLTPLVILDSIAREEQSLDQLNHRFPSYAQVKDSVPCEECDKTGLLERVVAMAPSDAQCDTLDGVKLRYPDGWLLIRASGTEPLVRVFAEARTPPRAKTLARRGMSLIEDARTELISRKNGVVSK
jgi:phosphomannomutase/phosphoglucomutase